MLKLAELNEEIVNKFNMQLKPFRKHLSTRILLIHQRAFDAEHNEEGLAFSAFWQMFSQSIQESFVSQIAQVPARAAISLPNSKRILSLLRPLLCRERSYHTRGGRRC